MLNSNETRTYEDMWTTLKGINTLPGCRLSYGDRVLAPKQLRKLLLHEAHDAAKVLLDKDDAGCETLAVKHVRFAVK